MGLFRVLGPARVRSLDAVHGRVADPARQSGELKPLGGSESNTWNTLVANQVIAKCLSTIGFTEEQRNSQFEATISGLIGISLQDEIEGMIAVRSSTDDTVRRP
jgi:hypothetical protein